jgi:hypothetical protein
VTLDDIITRATHVVGGAGLIAFGALACFIALVLSAALIGRTYPFLDRGFLLVPLCGIGGTGLIVMGANMIRVPGWKKEWGFGPWMLRGLAVLNGIFGGLIIVLALLAGEFGQSIVGVAFLLITAAAFRIANQRERQRSSAACGESDDAEND